MLSYTPNHHEVYKTSADVYQNLFQESENAHRFSVSSLLQLEVKCKKRITNKEDSASHKVPDPVQNIKTEKCKNIEQPLLPRTTPYNHITSGHYIDYYAHNSWKNGNMTQFGMFGTNFSSGIPTSTFINPSNSDYGNNGTFTNHPALSVSSSLANLRFRVQDFSMHSSA